MRSFYQFAFRCADGSTKFIIVEAETAAQAECVEEAVGLGVEGCILLATFKNCESVGIANGAFVVAGFVEFMADMAGFDSMPRKLQSKIEAAAAGQETSAKPVPAASGQSDRLIVALTGLGFGAKSVRKWVQSLGPRAESQDLPSLVKDGVKALVSASAA